MDWMQQAMWEEYQDRIRIMDQELEQRETAAREEHQRHIREQFDALIYYNSCGEYGEVR